MGRLILFILGLILVALGAADVFIGLSLSSGISWFVLAYWVAGGFLLSGDCFLLLMSWARSEEEIVHLENEMMLPKEIPRAFFCGFFGLLMLAIVLFGTLEVRLKVNKPTRGG